MKTKGLLMRISVRRIRVIELISVEMLYVTKSCFLGVPSNEINNFILKTDNMLKSGP